MSSLCILRRRESVFLSSCIPSHRATIKGLYWEGKLSLLITTCIGFYSNCSIKIKLHQKHGREERVGERLLFFHVNSKKTTKKNLSLIRTIQQGPQMNPESAPRADFECQRQMLLDAQIRASKKAKPGVRRGSHYLHSSAYLPPRRLSQQRFWPVSFKGKLFLLKTVDSTKHALPHHKMLVLENWEAFPTPLV